MYTPVKTQQDDHDKVMNTDGLQNLDLGCLNNAGEIYRMLDEEEKAGLIDYIVANMKDVPYEIQVRQVGHFIEADPVYGKAVAAGLGIDIASLKQTH